MSLNFLQPYMHKAGAAAFELHRSLPQKDIGILLLTEPPRYKKKVVTIPKGYRLYPSSALKEEPRAAILAKPHLNCVAVDHLTTPDSAVVLLPTPLGTVLLASVYLDRNLPVRPQWLLDIFSFANSCQYGLIVGFDSNSHHTQYGFKTDERGQQFLDLALEHSLQIWNTPQKPTFDTLRAGARLRLVIDFTTSYKVQVCDWRVDPSYNGSDHNSLLFNIPFSPAQSSHGRKWSKADWPLFTQILKTERLYTPRMVNNKKIDHMVSNLYRVINKALDAACPIQEIPPVKPYSHWYYQDLKKQSRKL